MNLMAEEEGRLPNKSFCCTKHTHKELRKFP